MSSGSANQYPVMSLEQLKRLPVADIADNDCVLVMWWVGAMPREALDVIDAWGFRLINMNGFVWVKLTKKLLQFFGMGFWTRAGSESALIAVKGKPKAANRSIRAVRFKGLLSELRDFIEEVVFLRAAIPSQHSKKPEEFRNDIVQMCGDVPRIELFARQRVDGWDAWGNEVESDVVLEVPSA